MRTNLPDAGFMGLPVQTNLDVLEADIVLLGVPYGWPYPGSGVTAACAQAPTVVRRRAGRLAQFRGNWDFDTSAPLLGPHERRVVDAGDVPGDATDGPGNATRTTAAVAAILRRGAVPIGVGGDDSVVIPVLRAYDARSPLTVLQVDAHLDFRDEVDGVREGYSSPMRRASEMSHVDRVFHVGLRGFGSARPSDVEDSRAAGNVLVTARELRERGTAWLLDQLPTRSSIFLAFDLDGLDPSVAPGVSAPAPGGLRYEDAVDLLAGIRDRLAGAVFTEYAPALDVNELSALTVARLAAVLMG